jgi:hypothetical protein
MSYRRICKADIANARELHPIAEAADLVQTAGRILERIESGAYPPDRIDSACWRLADALLVLGQFAYRTWPDSPTPGVTSRTGRGAKLETKP